MGILMGILSGDQISSTTIGLSTTIDLYNYRVGYGMCAVCSGVLAHFDSF